jgi:hypothetical protein
MAISRLVKIAFLFNVLLCLLFIYSNYSLWAIFAEGTKGGTTFLISYWYPLSVMTTHYYFHNGAIDQDLGFQSYLNAPFILFWVSTIINLLIIVLIYRSKEK